MNAVLLVYAGPIVVIINFVHWRMHEAEASNTDFIFTSFWSVLREPLCNVLLLGAAIAIPRRIVQQVRIAGGNAWCAEAAYQLLKVQSDENEGAGGEEEVVCILTRVVVLEKGLLGACTFKPWMSKAVGSSF